MEFLTLSLFVSSLLTICFAAPANNHPQKRQTFTVTCLGPKCTDYPPTTLIWPSSISVPGGGQPKPTTTPKTTLPKTTAMPTTRKTSATSKFTPPTKTIKSTHKPTKTGEGEVGPSSTRCPVPLYYQCGGYYDGVPWTGCTKCVSGAKCIWQNDFYYQCVADE